MSDWIKTKDRLPDSTDCKDENQEFVWCYIYLNGDVCERPFNLNNQCWDDYEQEDFEFDALDPTHWQLAPDLPKPPKD